MSLEDVFKRAPGRRGQGARPRAQGRRAGSLEAFEDEIAKLPQDEVSVNVIHAGVGGINESDVMLAAASDAVILGFNVRPVGDARPLADREGVEIRTYSVIYQALDDLRAAMTGMLEPEEVEETIGTVEVRQTFRASRIGTIAGSYVTDGVVRRGAKVRVMRDGTVIYDTTIDSLKRFNDDAREVAAGLRVRHRAGQLPGRQGGRRPGGLRVPLGRARAPARAALQPPRRRPGATRQARSHSSGARWAFRQRAVRRPQHVAGMAVAVHRARGGAERGQRPLDRSAMYRLVLVRAAARRRASCRHRQWPAARGRAVRRRPAPRGTRAGRRPPRRGAARRLVKPRPQRDRAAAGLDRAAQRHRHRCAAPGQRRGHARLAREVGCGVAKAADRARQPAATDPGSTRTSTLAETATTSALPACSPAARAAARAHCAWSSVAGTRSHATVVGSCHTRTCR